jgi:putative endonuclease
MADHNDLGKLGEEMATAWLRQQGYNILHRNWRYSYFEIDIIAQKAGVLHIIEVKTGWFTRAGHPEQHVSRKKFKRLQRAADQFLFLNPGHSWLQYDILAITLMKGREAEYFMLEDVFL